MKYFNECRTIDEVKSTYKRLAMEHHPDRGGDTAIMQAINTEYAYACAYILKGTTMNSQEVNDEINLSERYRTVIEKIIHLPGIDIELCGHWIWVSGNTKAVKEQLKEAGLFYASKKIKWYYRPEEFSVKQRGSKTMDQIRAKYGSKKFHTNEAATLEH